MEQERSLRQVLSALPAYQTDHVEQCYQQALSDNTTKIIVLDDDPTGVQTVHDIFVYTDWRSETIAEALADGNKISFFLTNSRGLTEEQTKTLHAEFARRLYAVAKGKDVAVVSRGDSTLRGHYPLETETLRRELEVQGAEAFDGEILMPYFEEGGRYTVDNVHYVAFGDRLVPAGQTEFAHDKTFGYQSSNLCSWIVEKAKGAVCEKNIISIGLDELRAQDYAGITAKLLSLTGFQKLVVNAVCEDDVKVFVTALFAALKQGKRFLYRCAAGLAKIMGGVSSKPLLTRQELVDESNPNGGLIVVGSHVNKTTLQLAALKEKKDVCFLEINQHLVVDEKAFDAEMDRVISQMHQLVQEGKTCAVYTRRERFDLNNGSKEDELRLAVKISDAVTSVVSRLSIRPNFIIAKGGITSSEVGTKGLGCRKALVLGQILKGVPVWKTGEESKFPGLPYVIFPGNVGSEKALLEAVDLMQPQKNEV